jgi:hypothetical protein
MVAAVLTNLERGANQHTKEGTSIDVTLRPLNVGRASVERARKVLASGDLALVKSVEQGTQAVSSVANIVKAATNNKGKGSKNGDNRNPSEIYDEVQEKLIEKLQKLPLQEAEAAAEDTVKQLRKTVTTMKAGAKSAVLKAA